MANEKFKAEELDILLSRVCAFDEPIRNAAATCQLCVMASGSGSPCISMYFFVWSLRFFFTNTIGQISST
jgi:hypothetical protein